MTAQPIDGIVIGIVWRNDGEGKGGFWDHMNIQRLFRRETKIITWNGANTDLLSAHICSQSANFGLTFPGFAGADEVDIIVIPGVVRKADESARALNKEKLLRTYFEKKPMILLCGGMWRLTALGATVGAVQHHANSRMVHLNVNGKIVHNTAIHKVCPTDCTIATNSGPMVSVLRSTVCIRKRFQV